jgi:hypothetical protein
LKDGHLHLAVDGKIVHEIKNQENIKNIVTKHNLFCF